MNNLNKEYIQSVKSDTPTLNLHQKLVEVRKSIPCLTKDTKGYKYVYVSGSQVLSKIKNKMDELGIILQPDVADDCDITCLENGDWVCKSKMKYIWINSDDPEDRITVSWYLTGMQNDPSKAFGSALTYSERYFLLKFFGIPTDDDDADAQQQQPKTNEGRAAYQPKQEYKSTNMNTNGDHDILKFGKYKGESMIGIAKSEQGMSYLKWILQQENTLEDTKRAVIEAISLSKSEELQ